MSDRVQAVVLGMCVMLVFIDAGVTANLMTSNDKVSAMHDQLVTAQADAATYKDAYAKLLEKVGGSNVPISPVVPKPRPGNLGDKS